jgi:hypothetical protein
LFLLNCDHYSCQEYAWFLTVHRKPGSRQKLFCYPAEYNPALSTQYSPEVRWPEIKVLASGNLPGAAHFAQYYAVIMQTLILIATGTLGATVLFRYERLSEVLAA